MVAPSYTAMSRDFPKRIHQALKSWYKQSATELLSDLMLAWQIQTKQEASPRLIANQILMDGLDHLKQMNAEAFDLLQRRFLNKETAREIAYRRNIEEDAVYQHQRAALVQLAQVIWAQEIELRRHHAQRIMTHLESPTYTRLFGATEMIAQIRAKLENTAAPWILAFEGMGGIGKTTLADALVRNLAYSVHFRNLAWISVRQRLFRLPGRIELLPECPGLGMTELVDRLIEQLELVSLKRQSDQEKLVGLKTHLKSHPTLIVIDNLETLPDYHSLVGGLRELTDPSKFLLTTRYSLRGESGVYIFQLQGLSREETLAFVRYEAELQGLSELANAPDSALEPIYDLTGGNPLATKLVIGQVHTFPLSKVLERLGQTKDSSAAELLTFVYADAWQLLDTRHRRVMQAMLLTSDVGGRLEQIAAITGFDIGETASCLHRLATLSLVNVHGGLNERRYALHQLTQVFVAQQGATGT